MASNKNIFCATNPAKMADALWQVMVQSGANVADMLIFLPSRRAVRSVEKMIVEKSGGAAILPRLVALGEGADEEKDLDCNDDENVISNTERIVVLARLLAADASVGGLSVALGVARDLVRMQDYLENEGIDAKDIDWEKIVDEKYAAHFQSKAKILKILSDFMPMYANGRITATAARNRDIRAWRNQLNNYALVIVCASTASVPATADLMQAIAELPHGRIILSGKISGRVSDFELNTNPYNSEYKFLTRLGLGADDVVPIDVGASVIDFLNFSFGNDCDMAQTGGRIDNCKLIECKSEAIEANAVAEIAQRAINENKSVLVITPDAAGNQRIAAALALRKIDADFSGGVSGAMTNTGRAILNLIDGWIEKSNSEFDDIYAAQGGDLFNTLGVIVDKYADKFVPEFDIYAPESRQIWVAIKEVSDALNAAGVRLNLTEARVFIADAVAGVSVRGQMNDSAKVVVLGTIESRMQTADVVILTGLNEGMFPARGYENAWLPRALADKIGLPSPDRKVSLQALDFMNLSCGADVYWLRSLVSGGVQTTESRFLSRVVARRGVINRDVARSVLGAIEERDNVPSKPLQNLPAVAGNDYSDVYVTELELLIHNPYAFYVRHILRLNVLKDYWELPDARDFGTLVHKTIEKAKSWNENELVADMDRRALEILGQGSVIFHFWHKRFVEIAPVIVKEFSQLIDSSPEIEGAVNIAGRNVRAKADRVWDGGVLDIKTGEAPSKSQLKDGNMPQLPLEAFILQQGGFPIQTTQLSRTPVMRFLQLKNNDARIVKFDQNQTQDYIRAAVDKVTSLFNIYSAGDAEYKYHETSDQKYKQYDDLARVK